MLTATYSCGLFGIDAFKVTVECSFTDSLPYFEIVGLPDNAVRESKRRIAAALENSGTPEAFAALCRDYFTEVLRHDHE